jgi:hypothetical protein
VRSLVLGVIAFALLLGAILLGANVFGGGSVRRGAGASPGRAAGQPPEPESSDTLTPIDAATGGTVRVGKLVDGKQDVYEEIVVDGKRRALRRCTVEFAELSVLPDKNGELSKPVITLWDSTGEKPWLRLVASRGFAKLEDAGRGRTAALSGADVRLVGSVVGTATSRSAGGEEDVVVLEAEQLDVPLGKDPNAKKPFVKSLSSQGRVRIHEKTFDVVGIGFSATSTRTVDGTRRVFDAYRFERDVRIEAKGAAADPFGGAAGAPDAELVIDAKHGLVVSPVASPTPEVDRRKLEFAGPVTITHGAATQSAQSLLLVVESDARAAAGASWVPVELELDGDVVLHDAELDATASSMHVEFERGNATEKPRAAATNLAGPAHAVIRGAQAPPGLGRAADSNAADAPLTVDCRGALVLRRPAPDCQRLEASNAVHVDIASAGTTLECESLVAELRGADRPTLASLDAKGRAVVRSADVVASGDAIRWDAGASEKEPSTFDVRGEPRLDIANGAAFRSDLLVEDAAPEPEKDAGADPVTVTCAGPMHIEIAPDGARRTITLRDDVLVRSPSATDGYELRCRSLWLDTRSAGARSEVAGLDAQGSVSVDSARMIAAGDRLRVEPTDATHRRLVLDGAPAGIAFADSHDNPQWIEGRSLTAFEDAKEPGTRRIEARGDVLASLLMEPDASLGHVKPDATWTVASPTADIELAPRAAPNRGFLVKSLEASGGVVMRVDANEARGATFSYAAGTDDATGTLVGDGKQRASLSLENDYDSKLRDTALADEMRFVVSPTEHRLKSIVCPKGSEFRSYAPLEDLPAVAPPRPAGTKPAGALHLTTITCEGTTTVVPDHEITFDGGARAKSDDGSVLEGDRIVVRLLPGTGESGPSQRIAGITTTGTPGHLHYGDLDGYGDRIEIQPSEEWITLYGVPERDARTVSRGMAANSPLIHYNRKTGHFVTGKVEARVDPSKTKKN